MTFELCVPACNEAPTILRALEMLSNVLPKDIEWMITVADNGSTDGTAEIVEASVLPRVRVLRVAGKGKGIAVRTASAQSRADIFGFIDADLSVDPSAVVHLLRRVEHGARVVIGSRLLDPVRVHRSWLRTTCSRMFHYIAAMVLDVRQADTQCGLKMMNREAAQILARGEEDGWFFDLEFLARCQVRGVVIEEVPISWEEFRFAGRASKLRVVRDGWDALWALFRIRRRLKKGDLTYDA